MPRGDPTATATSVPAPVGGWNARDSLASMEVTDAITLDNLIPGTDRVDCRKGFAEHATPSGVTLDIDTLATWGGSTESMLAFAMIGANKRAFDCTAAGSPAANAAFTALGHTGTRAEYVTTMFVNTAGTYLYMTDALGENAPCHYNGTTWAAPAITGVTLANLVSCFNYRYRMFFIEKNTLNLWYLERDAIAGAAKRLQLGAYADEGGYLVAGGTWTVDAGDGVDDVLAVVTSKGQVLVYQGNDPSSASAWRLAGVYKTAPPIGRKPMFKYGASLLINTTDGYVPIESLFEQSLAQPTVPITDKIRKAFHQAALDWGSEPGWQAIYYPRGSYLLLNVPQSSYTSSATSRPMYQFVMNTQTRQWCRFTGMDARSWALLNGDLYFGGVNGKVYKADTGYVDGTTPIPMRCKQANNYFGMRGQQKQWTMARLTVLTDALTVSGAIYIDTDFGAQNIGASGAMTAASGAVWDAPFWDTVFWDADAAILQEWQTYGGIGHCAALVVLLNTNGASFAWYATDWLYIPCTIGP